MRKTTNSEPGFRTFYTCARGVSGEEKCKRTILGRKNRIRKQESPFSAFVDRSAFILHPSAFIVASSKKPSSRLIVEKGYARIPLPTRVALIRFHLSSQLEHTPACFTLRCFHLPLTPHTRFFIMLPPAQFGWNARLLALFLEPLENSIYGFIFFNDNNAHRPFTPFFEEIRALQASGEATTSQQSRPYNCKTHRTLWPFSA